ncbi:MAG: hypothetical protein CM15mP49_05930 [Actinomycetota bacterium]|nr:MAG: hypothetical protein CM15mP49_05930 [Actinomycetota bacterium]
MTGEADRPPMFVGIGMGDTNAGVHAFAAIGHALFHRTHRERNTFRYLNGRCFISHARYASSCVIDDKW